MEAGRDMRSDKRKLCIIEVEFSRKNADCAKGDCGPWVNYTCDISPKGIGFYSPVRLEKGSLIELLFNHLESKPLKAEVRWCSDYSENLFRVGAMFSPNQFPDVNRETDGGAPETGQGLRK